MEHEGYFDPLERVPATRPGSAVFYGIRRSCRMAVAKTFERMPLLLAQLAAKEEAISPGEILSALDAYLEPANTDAPSSNPGTPIALTIPKKSSMSSVAANASDGELTSQFYGCDDRAFEILYECKAYFKRRITRRYPNLDPDEIYDDAFQRVADTKYRNGARFITGQLFDPWFWTIVRRCAAEILRRRTPAAILVTPFGARLSSCDWRIFLDDESVELTLPSPTLHDLKQAIQQVQELRTRWKWAFDVRLYEATGRGVYLQFLLYSNAHLFLKTSDAGIPLLSSAPLAFEAELTTMTVLQATEIRGELLPILTCFLQAITKLPAEQQIVLLLCDLLKISLANAVQILQVGQKNADPTPPYGTVGRWRSTAKSDLCDQTVLSPAAIDAMLEYVSCAYWDPNLDEADSAGVNR
jgi:DNA-directed RNA polymerase specialized sigma24 family protein